MRNFLIVAIFMVIMGVSTMNRQAHAVDPADSATQNAEQIAVVRTTLIGGAWIWEEAYGGPATMKITDITSPKNTLRGKYLYRDLSLPFTDEGGGAEIKGIVSNSKPLMIDMTLSSGSKYHLVLKDGALVGTFESHRAPGTLYPVIFVKKE